MRNLPILDATSGMALPAEPARIAEVIADFDPNLELRWIPPAARNAFDEKPYGVFHYSENHPDGGYFVSFFRESEMDHRVIATLFKMRNASIDEVEAADQAREALRLKSQMEDMEEAAEFRKWAINAPVGAKHNGVRYT